MITTLAFLATLAPGAEPVTLRLIPSGATERTGGYRPVKAEFGATPTAKPAPGLVNPQYGTIVAGKRKIAFVIDEPEGKDAKLIVDANGNGDLSDDAPAVWKPVKRGAATMYQGSATVDIGKDVPVTIDMYRFDPKDGQRAALKSTLLYYFDYGYELTFKLDKKSFTSFVPGEPGDGASVSIDRNGDGRISPFKEVATVGKPFNFTGTTYKFVPSDGGLTLETADEPVPMTPMPPDLRIGQPALPIRTVALDGRPLDLSKDYKGKIVMVDFWATWCGPCLGELPNVKAAYAKYHEEGFDVLGISFDRADMADKLKAFTGQNGMPWRQVYEGKYWNTTVGEEYDVAAIPFTLLIDGDTGRILADEHSLRGPGLSDFIGTQLAAKKAGK